MSAVNPYGSVPPRVGPFSGRVDSSIVVHDKGGLLPLLEPLGGSKLVACEPPGGVRSAIVSRNVVEHAQSATVQVPECRRRGPLSTTAAGVSGSLKWIVSRQRRPVDDPTTSPHPSRRAAQSWPP
jgi:hypothetical protein